MAREGISMSYLKSPEAVEEILHQPRAIVFKHSTRCPTSAAAFAELKKFAAEHGDAPLYIVDVIQDRDLSRLIAEKTSLRHESPQVLILEQGRVVWHSSHYGITAEALAGHARREE